MKMDNYHSDGKQKILFEFKEMIIQMQNGIREDQTGGVLKSEVQPMHYCNNVVVAAGVNILSIFLDPVSGLPFILTSDKINDIIVTGVEITATAINNAQLEVLIDNFPPITFRPLNTSAAPGLGTVIPLFFRVSAGRNIQFGFRNLSAIALAIPVVVHSWRIPNRYKAEYKCGQIKFTA